MKFILPQMATLAFGALAGLSAIAPAYADTIDYPGDGQFERFWGPDSDGNQSYGETFTAPQSVLDDYSFTLFSESPFPFVSQVYAFDGTGPSGSPLYTSGTLETTGSPLLYSFTTDINLIAGDQYIAFVTNQPFGVSLGAATTPGSGLGYMEVNDFSDPGFGFSEGDPSIDTNWFCLQPSCGVRAAFNADFSDATSVPEPITLSIFGAGLAGVAAVRRRKKSKQT